MTDQISYQGFNATNLSSILESVGSAFSRVLESNPSNMFIAGVFVISAFYFLTRLCTQASAHQRITGTTIGSDARIRNRVVGNGGQVKQEIDDTKIQRGARISNRMS